MSSGERVPGTDTEVLPGHGWSQFGRTPPQYGQYGGNQGGYGGYGHHGGPGPYGPYDTAVFGSPLPPPQRPAGTLTGRQKVVAGLALAAVALGGGATGALVASAANGGQTVISSPLVKPVSSSSGNTIAAVAKAIQPSVVSIKITTPTGGGEGSGVILSADGLILTNNHVVAEAGQGSTVTVKFSDGKTASATVKGTDPTTDLAVIQAQGVSGLTPASLGDSDKLEVGDSVLAIGSPLGLEGSVTSGIVSALDRTLTEGGEQQQPPPFPWGQEEQQQQPSQAGTTIGGMIQTDAAINPGNSGGALVNSSGQVIGINTAIATSGSSSGNIGVGFAIPINTAKQVGEQLIKNGKATHAYLGVSVADATGDAAGAVVSSITAGSPADKIGLKDGDLITKINDTVVDDAETLVGAIRSSRPGDKVTITYTRNGKSSTVTTALAEQSATS
ncbi:trypsin-like peptidase domain-containing protein [Planotetraspora sp. A-T 1434]|uniref:S1C family serine protease n=1 Tax=Planotetraspora sp. A-T 1434 TaxID=2979219 RepID=UPI0021BEEC0B|nr:trypsin-like peptidase domain-containing protein [Planotetraspora sp. A-T 1434]MCT9933394.1 trypsin-like peptidase domain-containing protein [Planotetraspora sp. A-T 1434]